MDLIHALAEEESLLEVPLRAQHLSDMLVEDIALLIVRLQRCAETEVQVRVQLGQHIAPVPWVTMPEGGQDVRSASAWLAYVQEALRHYQRLGEVQALMGVHTRIYRYTV